MRAALGEAVKFFSLFRLLRITVLEGFCISWLISDASRRYSPFLRSVKAVFQEKIPENFWPGT